MARERQSKGVQKGTTSLESWVLSTSTSKQSLRATWLIEKWNDSDYRYKQLDSSSLLSLSLRCHLQNRTLESAQRQILIKNQYSKRSNYQSFRNKFKKAVYLDFLSGSYERFLDARKKKRRNSWNVYEIWETNEKLEQLMYACKRREWWWWMMMRGNQVREDWDEDVRKCDAKREQRSEDRIERERDRSRISGTRGV